MTLQFLPANLDAAEVRAAVKVPAVLRALGVILRPSHRTDCPFCKGHSTGTLSYTAEVFFCHRCHEAGDVFTLLQRAHGYDFKAALRDAADLAGVPLRSQRPAERAAMLKRKRQRERAERAARRLEAAERRMRLAFAEESRSIARNQKMAGERLAALYRSDVERFPGETEATERTLAACPDLLRRVLAAYSILSFAAQKERVRFLLEPQLRGEMIRDALLSGFVGDEDGRAVEVLSA